MKKITLLLVVLFNNAFSQSVSNVSVLSVTPTTAVIGYYANITGATNPMVAQGYYYIVSTNTIVSTGTNYYIPPNHNAATQLSFPVNSLSPSTDYRYVVQIADTVTGFTNQTRPEVIFTTLANPVAPTISSVSSASVTDSGATINYTVNPNGAATTPIIRYGLSASALTSTQNCAVVSAGYTNVAQTQVLSGLAPSTTYHYRVEASNSVGSTPTGGPVSTFTTLATPALIYHWEFNNNLNATVGSVAFSAVNVGGTPPTYANSNTALVGASRQWFANLPLIPVGRMPRTIVMKVIIPTGG